MTSRVTIFIPTLDAGEGFGDVLDAVLSQKCDFEFDLLVFDSESADAFTHRSLRQRDITWTTIERAEFNHGQTRNEAARAARGEIIVFLSQDACPADDHWLAHLVAPILGGKAVAAFAAQRPRPDCHPFQRLNLDRHMTTAGGTQLRLPLTATEYDALTPVERVGRIGFDNVASAIRRSTLLARPFPITDFAEDLAWSRTTLLDGDTIAFVPEAVVLHSHKVSKNEFFDRVIAVHKSLRELCDFVPIASRWLQIRRIAGTMLRFLTSCLRSSPVSMRIRLWGLITAPWYAVLQMEAMYRGGHAVVYRPPPSPSTEA